MNFWANQWGDRILFSHGTNRPAIVAICFSRFPGDIITHRKDAEGHWLMVVLKVDSHVLILVNVYGYRTIPQNKQVLENISNALSELKRFHPTDFILMGGDWNITPDEWEDWWPSRFDSFHYNSIIEEFTSENSLAYIWRKINTGKKQYSWYKPTGTSNPELTTGLLQLHLGSSSQMFQFPKLH